MKAMEKNELRRWMRRMNRAVPPEVRAAASKAIFEGVERSEAFRQARCVGLFCALADEPSTEGVAARWAATGRRVVVPRVEGDAMRFFDYDPQHLMCGAFGIEEPAADATLCPPEAIDLLVVPGVAFTAAGDRMGRGRGYYDRYLSCAAFRGRTVGVCYAHQLVASLPVEPHDVRMDEVAAG